jgi:hypothetical protein
MGGVDDGKVVGGCGRESERAARFWAGAMESKSDEMNVVPSRDDNGGRFAAAFQMADWTLATTPEPSLIGASDR